MKSYLVTAVLLVFASLVIWYTTSIKERGKQDSVIFNTSTINGKITYLSVNVGVVYFKVENSEVKYMFIPAAVSGKKEERFSAFAKEGDSISKPANAAILKLYKAGKGYKYKFRNLHELTDQRKKVKPNKR